MANLKEQWNEAHKDDDAAEAFMFDVVDVDVIPCPTSPSSIPDWQSTPAVSQFTYGGDFAIAWADQEILFIVCGKTRLEIPKLHAKFAGIISDADGNFYIIFGEDNNPDDDSVETIFISKHTPDGELLETTGFSGFSKWPFERANCRLVLHGDMLVCHYGTEDDKNYMSSDVIAICIRDMKKILSPELAVRVGQSHGQRVLWSQKLNCYVFANQGAASPRGFEITFALPVGHISLRVFTFYLQGNANNDRTIMDKE
jgi:hypothetical protein